MSGAPAPPLPLRLLDPIRRARSMSRPILRVVMYPPTSTTPMPTPMRMRPTHNFPFLLPWNGPNRCSKTAKDISKKLNEPCTNTAGRRTRSQPGRSLEPSSDSRFMTPAAVRTAQMMWIGNEMNPRAAAVQAAVTRPWECSMASLSAYSSVSMVANPAPDAMNDASNTRGSGLESSCGWCSEASVRSSRQQQGSQQST